MKADELLINFEELQDGVGQYSGLTVRDYIAIEAMSGMISGVTSRDNPCVDFADLAVGAYGLADAMIEQSNKE